MWIVGSESWLNGNATNSEGLDSGREEDVANLNSSNPNKSHQRDKTQANGAGSTKELGELKEAIIELYLAIKIRSSEEVS